MLKALSEAKEEFTLFFFTTLILLFISAAGIYYFEHPVQPEAFSSILHSLWWAIVTLTTVGYGDVYPITLGGRIFTFIILLIGLGVVAAPAGLIASALSKVREAEDQSCPLFRTQPLRRAESRAVLPCLPVRPLPTQ